MKMQKQHIAVTGKPQGGFTLLELLVVIAIMATVAGGLLVSYDGLDGKAEKGQATFNLAAIDKGIRAFKVVSGSYPDNLDNLVDDAVAPAALLHYPAKCKASFQRIR
jgi:prepilin-type N-terminal cleavage/methylation domain-containing protein